MKDEPTAPLLKILRLLLCTIIRSVLVVLRDSLDLFTYVLMENSENRRSGDSQNPDLQMGRGEGAVIQALRLRGGLKTFVYRPQFDLR